MNETRGTSIEAIRSPVPAQLPMQQAGLPVAAGEMAASAIAAQARATVLARYEMALRQPRNWDQVRSDLLKECRRPTFANNKSALYRKPIGEGVEGLGIRFVEVALRCMKNVLIESVVVFEDDLKEIHRVTVTDLESNTTYPMDVKVSKTVERKKPADDGSYLSVRKNSYGKDVYTVQGTDDDLLNKRQALISKAIRTLGLRVIPGDLQDEAEEIIRAIRADEAAKDPDSERRKIVDAFAEIGVSADMLVDYLGHPLEQIQPKELVDLRGYYGAIRDGEATWQQMMEQRRENPAHKPGAGAKSTEELKQQRKDPPAPEKPAAPAKQPEQQQPAGPTAVDKATGNKAMNVVTERGRIICQIGYTPKLGDIVQDAGGFNWRIFEVREDHAIARSHEADKAAKPAAEEKEKKPDAPDEDPIELKVVLEEIMGATTPEDVTSTRELIKRLPEAERVTANALLETKEQQIKGGGKKPSKRGQGNLE